MTLKGMLFGTTATLLREGEGVAGGGAAAVAPAAEVVPAAPAADEIKTALSDAFVEPAKSEADGDKPEAEGEGEESGKDETTADTPFEVAVPEGMETYSDAFKGYQGAVNDFLKDNPKASARDALKWAAEYQAGQTTAAGKALMDQFKGQISTWEAEAKADPEIGGAQFDATVGQAVAGIKAVGSPKLIEALNQSGLGSHPEVIRTFAKIGKLVGESPVLSGEGAKGEVAFANSLYGKKG